MVLSWFLVSFVCCLVRILDCIIRNRNVFNVFFYFNRTQIYKFVVENVHDIWQPGTARNELIRKQCTHWPMVVNVPTLNVYWILSRQNVMANISNYFYRVPRHRFLGMARFLLLQNRIPWKWKWCVQNQRKGENTTEWW